MAERLTEKDGIENKRYMLNSEYNTVCVTNARLSNCSTIAYCWGKPIDKLAQLEDIMDKYHCNDIEELEKKLADGDTWQKACELACEHISAVRIITNDDMLENQSNLSTYFYQQAKTEGNDE